MSGIIALGGGGILMQDAARNAKRSISTILRKNREDCEQSTRLPTCQDGVEKVEKGL